jgi:hypothetical protein
MIPDSEGIEIPAQGVAGAALLQTRDCMAADVKNGRLNFGYRIDVHDEAGELVHSLPFEEVLEIVGSDPMS